VLVPSARAAEALQTLTDADTERQAPTGALHRENSELCAPSHPLELLDHVCPTSILRLQNAHAHLHMGALLRLLFLPRPTDEQNALVNLTWSPDNELSIFGARHGTATSRPGRFHGTHD
jgi:hypothetical protein